MYIVSNTPCKIKRNLRSSQARSKMESWQNRNYHPRCWSISERKALEVARLVGRSAASVRWRPLRRSSVPNAHGRLWLPVKPNVTLRRNRDVLATRTSVCVMRRLGHWGPVIATTPPTHLSALSIPPGFAINCSHPTPWLAAGLGRLRPAKTAYPFQFSGFPGSGDRQFESGCSTYSTFDEWKRPLQSRAYGSTIRQ